MNKKSILIHLHAVSNMQTERWTTNIKYIICNEVFSLYTFRNACWNHEITSQTLRNKVTITIQFAKKSKPNQYHLLHEMNLHSSHEKSEQQKCWCLSVPITIVLQFTLQVSIKEWMCKRNRNVLGSDLFWHMRWEANSSDVSLSQISP